VSILQTGVELPWFPQLREGAMRPPADYEEKLRQADGDAVDMQNAGFICGVRRLMVDS
jgi:hypothetical protein